MLSFFFYYVTKYEKIKILFWSHNSLCFFLFFFIFY